MCVTNLCNSCHFKDRQSQVEFQLWQRRRDPPDTAVNGDQVLHSWNTCSLVRGTKGVRDDETICGTNTTSMGTCAFTDVGPQQCSVHGCDLIATFYSIQAAHSAGDVKACRPKVRHEEVGQVRQGLPGGRQLPVQHRHHTGLMTPDALCDAFAVTVSIRVSVAVPEVVPLSGGTSSCPDGNLRGQA